MLNGSEKPYNKTKLLTDDIINSDVQWNLDIVDFEIVEFLEIVDKTALTVFLLSKIPCYSGIFMISFIFDIVDKIFQLKVNFQCHLMRNFKDEKPSNSNL